MADYTPPSGPPPPKAPEVPAGWVARWNDQYKEWFYVNVYTKKSQWEKPTAPVLPAGENAPDEPPPGYEPGSGPAPTDIKKNPYEDHHANPAAPHHAGPSEDEDAKLAAKLQAEEDARARYASPGASSYAGAPGGAHSQQDQFPQDLPPRDRDRAKGGFLGKLFGKAKASAGGGYGGYSPQPQPHGFYQSPPPQLPQQGYGGYGPMGGYGQPQAGYGQGSYGGGYGGYPPQQGYGPPQTQAPAKRPGMGGMGMGLAGGAALGMGAGMLGGGLLAHEMHERDEAYEEGYQDAQDNDFGGGGDFDGGDFGGGDF
ncbi:hypothetical protein XA68_15544 [Ophiocordyceps unilateralis]|uniref:WW domain-containing protein n=1 Tax=Ophiocordyceps unilateralis TaxID=268505 RepID=A0A2A9PM95_OPHUN|nr:hypothetical protein XA68_15544 [Ophiocordyceps unilateralis]